MTNINYKPAVLGMQEKHHSSAVANFYSLLYMKKRGLSYNYDIERDGKRDKTKSVGQRSLKNLKV